MKTPESLTKLGFQLIGAMALIFVTLKLTSIITWPWWWMTVAMYSFSTVILIVVIVSFIFAVFEGKHQKPL